MATTINDPQLVAFLREAAEQPFVWGVRDCWLWPASWVELKHGVDPAAAWRGRYKTALGAARLIKSRGGAKAFSSSLMAAAGFMETTDPMTGDVALIETGYGAMGAVCLRRTFAVKTVDGLCAIPASPTMAWRI